MRKSKKKKDTHKILNRKIFSSIGFIVVLSLLIISIGYFMFGTNVLKVGINTTTASYISFNDKLDSDTIITDNLIKYNESKVDKIKPIQLNVKTLNNDLEYEIVLVPVNVSVDYKYIKYKLDGDDINIINSLDKTVGSNDLSGNVIYNGKLKKTGSNDRIDLRVWIDDDFKGEVGFNSFEVKIKLK